MKYECHFMLSSGFVMVKELSFEGGVTHTFRMRQFPKLTIADLSNPTEPSEILEAKDIDFHLEQTFRAHRKHIAYFMET